MLRTRGYFCERRGESQFGATDSAEFLSRGYRGAAGRALVFCVRRCHFGSRRLSLASKPRSTVATERLPRFYYFAALRTRNIICYSRSCGCLLNLQKLAIMAAEFFAVVIFRLTLWANLHRTCPSRRFSVNVFHFLEGAGHRAEAELLALRLFYSRRF